MTSQGDEKSQSEKPSVSNRKIEANRRNALKSTGPRTPQGKAYSRRNSLKHGLLAKDLFTTFPVQKENPQELMQLLKQLQQEYKPVGAAEKFEVERIAQCLWRFRRAWRYENAHILAGVSEVAYLAQFLNGEEYDLGIGTLMAQLRNIEKQAESTRKIPQELLDQLFAATPAPFRKVWSDIEKVATQEVERGIHPERLQDAFFQPLRKYHIFLLTTKLAIDLSEMAVQAFMVNHPFASVAYDAKAIPDASAVDKIVRYEAAIDRSLGRALDRLERLQRSRKGEPVLPPVSVRLTQ